jgi:toxin ParE1/3/4
MDLAELQDYLAERFSLENARAFVRRFTAACKSIALAPHRSTRRTNPGPDIRSIGFERSVSILFAIETTRVVILCVEYGGRTPRIAAIE